MKKIVYTSFILLGFMTIAAGQVLALPVQTQIRDEVIANELDCVTKSLYGNNDVAWSDVCYTQDRSAKRSQAINQALDEAERNSRSRVQKPNRKFRLPPLPKKDIVRQDSYKTEEEIAQKSSLKDYIKKILNKKKGKRKEKSTIEADLQVLGGFRRDKFNWNIAGNTQGTSPNILSELSWTDLKMTQIKAKSNITFLDHFVVTGIAASSDIYSGDNQDSDYLGDDRTLEFSRSNNQSDDGEALDLSAGIGYKFHLGPQKKYLNVDDFFLTVLGGYSHHELNLIITDGFQTIPATGSFPGLHSSYNSKWKGPWYGVELSGIRDKLKGFFRFEYHDVDYTADANWNLRSDFAHPVSFTQQANGNGFVYSVGGSYLLNNHWSLDFNADIQNWDAKDGIDTVFTAAGGTLQTKLNEVNWDSYAFMFGATYNFF